MSFLSTKEGQEDSAQKSASGEEGSSFNVSSLYDPSQARPNSTHGDADDTKKNLWSDMLDSVGKRTGSKEGHLLLLGDHDAGKRSLLKAMNKPFLKSLGIPLDVFDEYGSHYAPFESSFLYVHEHFGESYNEGEGVKVGTDENLVRLNVWLVSDADMGSMIKSILKPDDLEYTFAVIVPNLEQPWNLVNHCQKWMKVLTDAIYEITPQLSTKAMDKLRGRIEDLYKTYTEPEFDKDGKLINKKIKKRNNQDDPSDLNESSKQLDDFDVSVNLNDDQDLEDDIRKEMALPEGTLVTNPFIPVAIVCSKLDLIQSKERSDTKSILEKNLDYISYTLRKFCLQYGAALVFASANANTNVKLLYDYIQTRIYDEDQQHPSNVNDKEALFIPTGFDSMELINQTDLRQYHDQVRQLKLREDHDFDEMVMNTKLLKARGLPNQEGSKEEFKCPEWKSRLEESHKKLQEMEQQKLVRRNTKKEASAAAGGAAGLQRTGTLAGRQATQMQNMQKMGGDAPPVKPNKFAPTGAAGAPPNRQTLGPGSNPALATAPNAPTAKDDSGAAQPAATASKDPAKQNAKVKDFYQGILNKKKAKGAPTPSNKAGAGELITDEQIQPEAKE